ncbi:MAG: hypothetical protein KH436_03605 [Firmicutes bacterium]|nr:hypothetical protein [Clostridia bacterium]MBS6464004.1 hypothetical protein [Bacillota bacterium]
MDQSKFRKIVIASTVTAVILLVTLLSVMVYQLVSIFTYKNAIAELEREIAAYEQMIDETGDTIETRSKRWWIERRARELGYIYSFEEIV